MARLQEEDGRLRWPSGVKRVAKREVVGGEDADVVGWSGREIVEAWQ